MARTYHIDIAAIAAGSDRKWVDNLVSHFGVAGVESARRGVPRRIATAGLYRIVLIRRLHVEFGVSIAQAVNLADRLFASAGARVPVDVGLELTFDRAAFETAIDARIAEAVETFRPAPRGRPPVRRSSLDQR
jgi:hypothetical protein